MPQRLQPLHVSTTCAATLRVSTTCIQVYLPLLAFAGGFPTTLLYGLLPSVAVLALARSGRKAKAKAAAAAAVNAAVNAAFNTDADADADDDADAAASAATINSVPVLARDVLARDILARDMRDSSPRAMATAPMVDSPTVAAPPGGGEGRLLSEATHWAVAAIAVGLLTTSAVCYGLPGKAVHVGV